MVFRMFCLLLVLGLGINSAGRVVAQFEDDDVPTEIIDPDTGEGSGGVAVQQSLCIKTIENVSCLDKYGVKPADSAPCNTNPCNWVCDGVTEMIRHRPDWEAKVDRAIVTPFGQWGKLGTLKRYKCVVSTDCLCDFVVNSSEKKCRRSQYHTVLESFSKPQFDTPNVDCPGRM